MPLFCFYLYRLHLISPENIFLTILYKKIKLEATKSHQMTCSFIEMGEK